MRIKAMKSVAQRAGWITGQRLDVLRRPDQFCRGDSFKSEDMRMTSTLMKETASSGEKLSRNASAYRASLGPIL
jgi:hypothetical protein